MSSLQVPKKRREQELLRILEDPTRFAQCILRHRVWSKQLEILQSVARHARTAVKACHASGKTFTAAEVVLWWITLFLDGIAITTAPTWTQVERVLWAEIRNAVYGSVIQYPKPHATSLQLGPGRYAIGLSTNEGVRFQGFHGNVLIILDEAPGILPEIWEAIEGIRAGGDVRVLALGNPTIASGPFYDAFTSQREGWNLITISAFDTPNLEGITLEQLLDLPEEQLNDNPCPYLTTRQWVKEKYREWGPGHPLWESRVMGNFPTDDPQALIPLQYAEQARLRQVAAADSGELFEAGIDVADGGDNETVLCVRQGSRIVLMQAWTRRDPRGEVEATLAPYKSRLASVKVDKVGVGAYFEKHFTDLGYETLGVNVGEAPYNAERFANLKAELYWGLRERFQQGDIWGALDERTIAQLSSIRYELTPRGQIAIESKEKMARRGVKSPDRAEALMLAFAVGKSQGLFELWREQAEALKAGQQVQQSHAAATPQDLAQAQKAGAAWMTSPKRLGQAAMPLQPTECCPKCGDRFLARYSERWKCNLCGESGQDVALTT
jgi:phage terminase large subunit